LALRKQTVIWTALPNGFAAPATDAGPRLRLSVLVSPRLVTNEGLPRPELAQFPDFAAWPAVNASFQVRFDGGPTVAAQITGAAPSLDLWQALFQPDCYVKPFEFKRLDDRLVRSFPVGHVMSFLRQQYVQVAKSRPFEHPSVEFVANSQAMGQIATYQEPIRNPTHDLPNKEKVLQHQLEEILVKAKAVPPSATPNPPLDFYQVKQFFRPRNQERMAVTVPELDFHQVVSALGDYPEIMRRLGLVIDLEIPYTTNIPASGRMQVIPSWAPALPSTTSTLSWTRYLCDGSVRFLAASRPGSPELADGMLNLSDAAGYSIMQVDVDGAALKGIDLANNLLRANSLSHRAPDTPTHTTLPAMRSHGLSLVRTGRAIRLVQALMQAKARNDSAEAGSDVEFYAEDLTRGYRVDVWDDRSTQWRSLCKRVGLYKFTKGDLMVSAEDEGTVTMGVTQSSDGSSSDLYVHESLLRWEGWSLAVPRPGKVVSTEDNVDKPENKAATEFHLETSFQAAPKSLPKLRFGTTYRMRARAVDLTGNSLPADSTDDTAATSPVTYTRAEPISSPALVLRSPNTEGEALERVVIRSNYNVPSAEGSERHIAPPKTAQLMAEVHGMFDSGSQLDKAAYDLIVAREGAFNADGIHSEDQLALPYLPDPAGRGAALQNLPGMAPGAVKQVLFAPGPGGWPDWLPFRIAVVEGAGAPSWDNTSRVLTVQLPKAEIVPVRLSTYLNENDLELMGLWQWLKAEGLPAAQLQQLKDLALKGRHWMISPYRELTLVHAVQQPLTAPAYQTLQAAKALGQTFATLTDAMPISGKSTNKLDVLAKWQEPIDALAEPAWKMMTGQAHAGEMQVGYGETTLNLSMKHEFGDTKYRRVEYSAVATSRFKEYFQEHADETISLMGDGSVFLAHTALVELAESVTNSDGTATYVRDIDYKVDYAAGTIARVAGGAIADGDSVKVTYTYLAGPITRETAAPVAVDVLNSARPAAPKVLYAVPTFAWSRDEMDEGESVRRLGGGLRIYMERPWFSSGDGELLGAVLWTQPTGIKLPLIGLDLGVGLGFAPKQPPEALRPFVTQWGNDPLWLSGNAYAVPSLAHFPMAAATGTDLTLDEVSSAKVMVAGHAVGYDEGRQLWYCDMEIDAGQTYWPFVRLALARYQPNSVDGAHLSRVVLADYAQLAPDRLATVIWDPDYPVTLAVTVCGPGYRASGLGQGSSYFEVSVETRSPDIEGDLGWVQVPNATFPLKLTDTKGASFTWSGGVTLPGPRGERPYRLVVKEYEGFRSDSDTSSPAAGQFTAMAYVPKADRRLVYAAVLHV
jgi:hypothetical protein